MDENSPKNVVNNTQFLGIILECYLNESFFLFFLLLTYLSCNSSMQHNICI